MQQQIPAPEERGNTFFDEFIDQLETDIIIADVQGNILHCNKSILASWGGKREDYIGKKCMDLQETGNVCLTTQSFFDRVTSEGHIAETYTDVRPDGRMDYYHINVFPLRDKGGEIRRLVLSRRNTTAEMQIEQRLYQAQKMAAIGELSTYIAHEIRNPLFAIGGFANALLRIQSLDESAREKAQIILEESQRLDDILKSILNFARPTEQSIGAVDVNALAAQTVELMALGTEKNIPITMQLAENIPHVHGNAEMLKQCLINLIKNAQEAMREGVITVYTSYVDGTVYLKVGDNGPGIPQELQEKIFSPFFSTKDKGAGLGLAMTRKIINEIGGKLLLHSHVGQGTLVSMGLRPVLAVEEDAARMPGEK